MQDSPKAVLDGKRLRLVVWWQTGPFGGGCAIRTFGSRPFLPLDRCECLLGWTLHPTYKNRLVSHPTYEKRLVSYQTGGF